MRTAILLVVLLHVFTHAPNIRAGSTEYCNQLPVLLSPMLNSQLVKSAFCLSNTYSIHTAKYDLSLKDGQWAITWPNRRSLPERHNSLMLSYPEEFIEDEYKFYGLASYYDMVSPVAISNDFSSLEMLEIGAARTLSDGYYYGWKSRFHILYIVAGGDDVVLSNSMYQYIWHQRSGGSLSVYSTLRALDSNQPIIAMSKTRYIHLWGWLSTLASYVEYGVQKISQALSMSIGVSILLAALIVKLLILPVSLLTLHYQKKVSVTRSKLEPVLREIKKKYTGEEAHNKILVAYARLGVSPFYTLKPMIGLFVQLPVLIAIFSALGEMPSLSGAEFLWIDDLARPDRAFVLPVAIPFMGNSLNMIPVIMLFTSIISAYRYSDCELSSSSVRRHKNNLYFMSFGIFFVFYPFPAAMVLYWTMSNTLYLVQQELIRALNRVP